MQSDDSECVWLFTLVVKMQSLVLGAVSNTKEHLCWSMTPFRGLIAHLVLDKVWVVHYHLVTPVFWDIGKMEKVGELSLLVFTRPFTAEL